MKDQYKYNWPYTHTQTIILDQITVFSLNIFIPIHINAIYVTLELNLLTEALLLYFLIGGMYISGLSGSGWVFVTSGKNL